MNYKLFCKKKSKVIKDINLGVFLLIIISLFFMVFGLFLYYKMCVIATVVLFIIEFTIERKSIIFDSKESEKAILDKPLVIGKGNLYILKDKTIIALIILFIFLFVEIVLFKLNGSLLYYYVTMCFILLISLGKILTGSNEKYIMNNKDCIESIVINKNMRYGVLKITNIVKNEDGSYTMSFGTETKKLYLSKDYDDYDKLIKAIDSIIK